MIYFSDDVLHLNFDIGGKTNPNLLQFIKKGADVDQMIEIWDSKSTSQGNTLSELSWKFWNYFWIEYRFLSRGHSTFRIMVWLIKIFPAFEYFLFIYFPKQTINFS